MSYESVKDLNDEQFRRATGIKKDTFLQMVEILKKEEIIKRKRGGRKSKLSIEDRVLMTFEYMREYRTYFHIGLNYGISESATYNIIKWVENTLIKHPDFALPGKKALRDSAMEDEVVLIDATETPIERPKKNQVQEQEKD